MSTAPVIPRDQSEGDELVHRVTCAECDEYLFNGTHNVFVRDCPGCGADVALQPLDPDLQTLYDSAPSAIECVPCDSPRAALFADWDGTSVGGQA